MNKCLLRFIHKIQQKRENVIAEEGENGMAQQKELLIYLIVKLLQKADERKLKNIYYFILHITK
nr:MAG TPA: hypothetical protein [Caudoviricetes sp.]